MEPKVIFEDSEILVLDKPAGMIVNKSDTTKGEITVQDWVEEKILRYKDTGILGDKKEKSPNILISQYPNISDFEGRAGIVHRLDKETSGILLAAKTPEVFENLQKQFKDRIVKKTYTALTHGKVEPSEGEINVPVGRLPWNRKRFGVLAAGREAVTKYKTIDNLQFTINNEPLTLLELYPKTGRTHQIRVHLQYFHHPIFADHLYAGRKTGRNDRKVLPRIFLHASKISFFGPKTGELVTFESPLPDQLKHFLGTLKA